MLLLIGLPIAVVTWFIGSYLVSQFLGARVHVDVPDLLFGRENGGSDADEPAGSRKHGKNGRAEGGAKGGVATRSRTVPSFGTVIGLLMVPLVLITGNTLVDALGIAGTINEDAWWVGVLTLLGTTAVALLIALLVAVVVLGRRQGSMADTQKIMDEALAPICSIILITGAGRCSASCCAPVARRRADRLALWGRSAVDPASLRDLDDPAGGSGIGHRRAHHDGGVDRQPGGQIGLRQRPAR